MSTNINSIVIPKSMRSKYVVVKKSKLNNNNLNTRNNSKAPKKRSRNRVRRILKRQLLTSINPLSISTQYTRNRNRNGPAARISPGTVVDKAYMMCRLNPFKKHIGDARIPDGVENRRILVDHRMTHTITIGSSGGCKIMLTPFLPSPILLQFTDSTTKLDNSTFVTNHAGYYIPILLPEWAGETFYMYNTSGEYDRTTTLYNSNLFRIVTAAWSITYTGSTMVNSGSITVNQSNLSLGVKYPINQNSFDVYSCNSGTDSVYAVNQIKAAEIGANPVFGVYGEDSYSGRLSVGAHGILKHSSDEFEFQPLEPQQTYIVNTFIDGYNNSMVQNYIHPSSGNLLGTVGPAHINGFDNEWSSTLIQIGGCPVDGSSSFILDVIYCIEYCPMPGSSVYPIAKSGPKQNKSLISKTQTMANQEPPASSGTFLNTASTIASTVGTLASLAATSI